MNPGCHTSMSDVSLLPPWTALQTQKMGASRGFSKTHAAASGISFEARYKVAPGRPNTSIIIGHLYNPLHPMITIFSNSEEYEARKRTPFSPPKVRHSNLLLPFHE